MSEVHALEVPNEITQERLNRFNDLRKHPVINKMFKKLTKSELQFCTDFIMECSDLTDAQFIAKANRLFIDQKEKPRNWKDIADLMSNTVIRKERARRD